MSGFIHDPLQIVNLITDNLRDRYKSGFPVLKEIIQNADDAGSADESIHLEFGLSDGLSHAQHPLLKGPALWFVNDGAFTDSDDKAIRSFGLNAKVAEQSSIGKFGLGMKSVFHFCEAFFFLAKNNDKKYEEILIPWVSQDYPSRHDDWNEFSSSDASILREHLKPAMDRINLDRQSYFLLWLPLRRREHLCINGKKVKSILSEFPGDDDKLLSFLFKENLAQEISSILPLLRRIESIRFWRTKDRKQTIFPGFHIALKKGARRIGSSGGLDPLEDLAGTISYQRKVNEKEAYSLVYSGNEKQFNIPKLLALRESPLWPKSQFRDKEGTSQEVPDKAEQHGALVFSRSNEKETGGLKIRWAVFLPVESGKEEVPCKGDHCYRITLHGSFFVDAGRVAIEGLQEGDKQADATAMPKTEAELRRLWNINLARLGTLLLLLPALEAFVIEARLSDDDVGNLCVAINNSNLFRDHRKSICVHSSWVCCLTNEGSKWRILNKTAKMLPLPPPPLSTPERPWLTFPELKSVQDRGVTLLLKDAPHLRHEKYLPQWQEDELLKVLEIDAKAVFSNQGCLEYLLKFLEDASPFLKMGTLQQQLREIAKQAHISLGTKLSQNKKAVQNFVSFILPEGRFSIKQGTTQIILELQRCKTSVLILGKEFDSSEAPGTARLSLDDAYLLLKKLHNLMIADKPGDANNVMDPCRAIAKEILQNQTEAQRRELLNRAKTLKILEGHDCKQKKPVALSPADLEDHKASHLLFRYSQGTNIEQRLGLANKLQLVVTKAVVVINNETAELVFSGKSGLVSCDANSVLDALGAEVQPLRAPENRWQLLSEVAGASLDITQRIRGLRYLLHGSEKHFEDNGTLWIPGHNQNPVWGKLWNQLESQNEDSWNLLVQKLVEEIPQNKWPCLSIKEIKPKGILEELRSKGMGSIAGDQFNCSERNAVLQEVVSDKNLWRNFPFHETLKGKFVCIKDGRSYLESDITLPDEMHLCADIIRLSNDPNVKRQQDAWLTPLSSEGAIQIALKHEQPEKFQSLIMDHLDSDGKNIKDWDGIRDTAWLLDADHKPVKPSDVICLEAMQDEVDRLLAAARGAYWSPGHLLVELQEHSAFTILKRHCFATGKDGFEILSLLLDLAHDYHVGQVDYLEKDRDAIIKTCARLPTALHLPGWTLLESAMPMADLPETSKEDILKAVFKPIPVDKVFSVLKDLQKEHADAVKAKKKAILPAFNAYLTALVQENGGKEALSELSLLNREGTWKLAKALCADAEGVADSHLLDDTQKQLLCNVIVRADHQQDLVDDKIPSTRNLQPEITASANSLEAFFFEWEGYVAPEIICAFLSLLGDDPAMLKLLDGYRGNHSLEWIRDKIPWVIPDRIEQGRKEWLYGLEQSEALARHRFIVRFTDGKRVQAHSILGDFIEVPLKSQFTSLIVGGLYYERPQGEIINLRIDLRKPQLEKVSPSELSNILRSSAEYLLKNAYNQGDSNLGPLWEELDKSEQFDIQIAQELILDNLPFYLRQLGSLQQPRLKKLRKQWDDARYKCKEYKDSDAKKKKWEEERESILQEIQALLENDDAVQEAVLNAVRAKIKDFQYTEESIPFELFQNADDAVVELAAIKAYPNTSEKMNGQDLIPEHVKRFLVIQQDHSLSFLHWGRPINGRGSAGFPGREKGFHQDLEKMLMLSASDKSEDVKVTGKFGLGFNSVLLGCDRPKLISGRLMTEIIAGLCPIPLKDSSQLRDRLSEKSPDRKWLGTLIELPLTEEKMPQDIMSSFSRLAGIMTIFAKQIRQIEIEGESNQSWQWKPNRIIKSETVSLELDKLPLPEDAQPQGLSLYFRLPCGGILLGLRPQGFRTLPDELPSVWVVAPTRKCAKLGFIVNGPFDLDAGRASLVDNDANKKKAHDLGRVFGKALSELYDLTQEKWEALKTDLHLEKDLSIYDFWSTFWDVMNQGLSRRDDTVGPLVIELLCKEAGLGYLLSRENTMPNGLWGDHQCLTRPDKIRVVLKGCLSRESTFRALIKWGFFKSLLGPPDSVVSDATYKVAQKVVPAIGETSTQWRSLVDVLHQFLETEKKVTPDMAGTLGQLFKSSTLKQGDFEKEREQIEKALKQLTFESQNGSFQSTNELLALEKHTQANPDEAKRAAFAPERYVLSTKYQESGLDFFFTCREKVSLAVEMMADWLLEAPTEEKKEKGLRYLLEGEHGEKVAKRLREEGIDGSWLKTLSPSSDCLSEWNEDDKTNLLFRILPSTAELYKVNYEEAEDFHFDRIIISPPDPEIVLNRIWAWWAEEKDDYLRKYEENTFPSGLVPSFKGNDFDQINRSAWLTLLVLGHCHTMGRQRNFQHKGFIELCIRKEWWKTFSAEKPETRSDEWMKILDDYIDAQVDSSEYEHWMNRFPAIYRISRGLEDYAELFLRLDRDHEVEIQSFLQTRATSVHQGGGVSAPPLGKTLGIGVCFVMRELVRQGILHGEHIIPYCFVPVKRVLKLCGKINSREMSDEGIDGSVRIHEFIVKYLGKEKATFQGCYDIPLQMVSEDKGLLESMLKSE